MTQGYPRWMGCLAFPLEALGNVQASLAMSLEFQLVVVRLPELMSIWAPELLAPSQVRDGDHHGLAFFHAKYL